jgi:O-antigen ligase
MIYSPAFVLALAGVIAVFVWLNLPARPDRPPRFPALVMLLWLCGPVSMLVQMHFPTDGTDPVGIVLRLSQGMTVLALVLSVVLILDSRRGARRSGLLLAMLVYYGTVLLSALAGTNPGLPRVYWLTPVIVLAALCYRRYGFEALARRAVWVFRFIMIATLVAVAYFPDAAFNRDGDRQLFGVDRWQGIAGHPNTLGAVAVAALLLELGLRRRKIWLIPPVVAVVMSQSHTSWVAAVLGVLALQNFTGRVLRRLAWATVFVGVSVALFAPQRFAAVYHYMAPDQASTLTGRTTIWAAAIKGFHDSPIFGYGPTLLDDTYRAQYLPGQTLDAAAQAHDQFVQSLGEAGVIGLAGLLLAIAVLLVTAWRARQVSAVPLALTIALLCRSVTETPWRPSGVDSTALLLVVTLGLAAAAYREYQDGLSGVSDQGAAADAERARPLEEDHRLEPGRAGRDGELRGSDNARIRSQDRLRERGRVAGVGVQAEPREG